MKRKVIDELIKWDKTQSDKPVLLTGAKGVGKTYLAYDFAKAFFNQILYINFEREPLAKDIFAVSDIDEVIRRLSVHFGLPLDAVPDNVQVPSESLFENNVSGTEESKADRRILILDEASFCPYALSFILLLQSSGLFPRIIVISSLPLDKDIQGQLLHIPIYPLQFDEFLRATSNDWYIEAIMTHFDTNKPIPEIVHKELLTLHELYMNIGGMPGIVNEYLNFLSTVNVPEQHSFLISSYHDYILKGISESEALKMNQVFDSLPSQLMKDNKKFQYKLIRKGTTHSMYKDAISCLTDRDYALQCFKVSAEQLAGIDINKPNEAALREEAGTNFKLYLPDTGFLYTKIKQEQPSPFEPSVRKALLENYAAQAFKAKGYPLMFWESESMAKLDFLIPKGKEFIPVEIHSDENTRSKSINVFKQKYDFPYAVKISPKNFELSKQIKYVPYYAVFCL